MGGTEARSPTINCCCTFSTAALRVLITEAAFASAAALSGAPAPLVALACSDRTEADTPSLTMVRRCATSGGMFWSMTRSFEARTASTHAGECAIASWNAAPLLALALSAASLRVHRARSDGGTTSSDTWLTSAAAASVAATAASAAHCDGVRLSGGSSLPVIGRGSLPS